MSAFYFKLIHGEPVACGWEEACALLMNPEDRLICFNRLVNGFQIRTSFNVIDIDPLRSAEPRLWSTLVESPDGTQRVLDRYVSQEYALTGHLRIMGFLHLCGEF